MRSCSPRASCCANGSPAHSNSPPQAAIRERGAARVARMLRDAMARVLPANLTGSLGRTLVIAGVGLILVRLIDMTVDDDASLF